jgi:serine/threonine protein kinase/tetratricopeptide (TPR) repeat protein
MVSLMDLLSRLPPRYVIRNLLGQGGMGAVYRAFDQDLSQDVALKVLRPDKKEIFGAFFRSEIRAAAQLCHPNIVPVYDAGQKDPPFLSMRYVSGGSLSLWLTAPPPWPVLLKGVLQVLEALSFAHARGVLHRDLKPENILLTEAQDALLADLGLAVSLEQLERTKNLSQEVYGTPRYMAPEQFLDSPFSLGPWTDLYALGVILYEIISGQRPFRGDIAAIFSAKRRPLLWQVRPNYLIPSGAQEIVERLLSFDPFARYELAADVHRALSSLPFDTPPPSEWDEITITTNQPKRISEDPSTKQPKLTGQAQYGEPAREEQRGPLKESNDQREEARSQPSGTTGSSGTLARLSLALMGSLPPDDPRSEEATRASLALFPIRDFGLVGRQQEKQSLWSLARDVLSSGKPRVVLLEGEAGVGKSRLLRWLRENLEQRGISRRILVREDESKVGSFVGVEGAAHRLLQSYHLPPDEVRRKALLFLGVGLEDEASAIASWLAPQPNQEPLSAAERDLLFFHLLSRESKKRGVVLVHWENIPRAQGSAGLATIERALAFHSNTQEPMPVLFLVTARPEDWAGSPGASLRDKLLQREDVSVLPVERLETETQSLLIEERAPITKELAMLVAERSEGNPLYAVELLKHWVMSGYLTPAERGKYQLRPGVNLGNAAPNSLTSLSQERIKAAISRAESPALASDALSISALLGLSPMRETLLWALSQLHGGDNAAEGFDFLVREGFLRVMPQTQELRFDHALLHSLLVERVEVRRDAGDLHRLCAEGLEGSRSDAATLSAAAAHWEKCGETLKAAQCFLRAGERWKFSDLARAEIAYQNTIRLAQQLDASIGESLIAEARLDLGRITRMLSRFPESEEHFGVALSSSDETVRMGALIGSASNAIQVRNLSAAEQQATTARLLAEKLNDQAQLSRALIVLGVVQLKQGATKKASESLELAQIAARRSNALHYLSSALRWMAQLYLHTKNFVATELALVEATQIANSLGASGLSAQLKNELGELLRNQGRFEEAQQAYFSYLSLSKMLGRQQNMMLAEIQLALVSLLMNDLSQGKDHIQRANTLRAFGAYWLAPLSLVSSWAAALDGSQEQAATFLEESLKQGIDKEADPSTALVLEKIGDASRLPLSQRAYLLSLSQWRRLHREEEISRTSEKLTKATKKEAH